MNEDINNPNYWSHRLALAPKDHRHLAVFRCPLDRWLRIEVKHRLILEKHIQPTDSILDAGCGWGRLIKMLPNDWAGDYLGLDLSPDFIQLARQEHPDYSFLVGSLFNLKPLTGRMFNWGILISMRPMIRRNLGSEVWALMQEQLKLVCRRLLFLEYDESDPGSIE